jgi:hypothetical protein
MDDLPSTWNARIGELAVQTDRRRQDEEQPEVDQKVAEEPEQRPCKFWINPCDKSERPSEKKDEGLGSNAGGRCCDPNPVPLVRIDVHVLGRHNSVTDRILGWFLVTKGLVWLDTPSGHGESSDGSPQGTS